MSIQEYLDTFIILNQGEIDKLNQEERMEYEDSLKYYRDLKNVVDTAKSEGKEEGREEGIKEGIEKGMEINQIETIKNGLLKGYSFDILSDITKLSIEKIQKIADSLNE